MLSECCPILLGTIVFLQTCTVPNFWLNLSHGVKLPQMNTTYALGLYIQAIQK